MPKIKFSHNKKVRHCGEYYWNSSTLTIFEDNCKEPTINPGYKWTFPHYFADRSILGVICHEFGHYLHEQLGCPKMGKLGLQITSYEPDIYERFAETIKLFLTNPNLLKQYNPKRYEYLTKKLNLKPIHDIDYISILTMYGPINQKYITACANKIKNANKSK